MQTITERLLAELRDAGHSWYRIARLLALSDQALNHQRKGGRMSDGSAVRACAALGKSERETAAVLAMLSMERAGDDETRAAWAYALKRLGGAVATVAALIIGPTPPASGAVVQRVESPVYYVKSPRRRRRARWLTTLRRLIVAPIAGILFLAYALTARADPFTAAELGYLGGALGAVAIDWLQTRDLARQTAWAPPECADEGFRAAPASANANCRKEPRFREINPLMPAHPSVADVDRYFVLASLATVGLARALPAPYRRYFLTGVVVLESAVILRNYSIGLRVAF